MHRRALIQMHLLVALFATTAVLGHLISLSATGVVVWRTLLASIGAAVFVAARPGRSKKPSGCQLVALLGIGVLVGLHWIFFFGAIKVSNISICLAGLATISFFTAFTEPLLERRPVRPLKVALGGLVFAGILLIAGFERGQLAGLGLALMSAFLAAVFPVLNRRLVNQGGLDPMRMVAWEMAGAFLVCLAALALSEGTVGFQRLFHFQRFDWLWLLLLAWVCTVFAHGFHIHLLRQLSAYTSNLVVNFEPIYGIFLASILFGEHRQLHPGFFAGIAAILLANFLHPWILHRVALRNRNAVVDSTK